MNENNTLDNAVVRRVTHYNAGHDFADLPDTEEVSTTTRAREISVPVEIESPDTLEENIYKHKARGDRFIPVPESDKFYDIKEESTKELRTDMIIADDADLIETLYRLRDFPFLLADSYENIRFHIFIPEDDDSIIDLKNGIPPSKEPDDILTIDEMEDEYPDYEINDSRGESDRYSIITITEVNRRATKIALYPYIAEFEGRVSELIENEYSNSQPLAEVVGNQAKRAWKHNLGTETEVHIAEFLNLSDMTDLIGDSPILTSKCGFDSVSQAEEELDRIREVRNKVMHANRTLVHSRDELEELTNDLKIISDKIEEIDIDNNRH